MAFAFFSASAWPQSLTSSGDEFGGARLRANVGLAAFYTDNFFYEQKNPKSATGTIVRPQLVVLTETSRAAANLQLRGEYGAFNIPGAKDDYLDGGVGLNTGYSPTYRNRFSLNADYSHGHDAFGVDRTEATSPTNPERELDQWNALSAGLRYRYGAPSARVNAELGYSAYDKEYVTNESDTEFMNYDSSAVSYTVFYNYSPKTALVGSFSRTDFEFGKSFGPVDDRSGQTYQGRMGLRWLASAKTAGDLQFGYRRREFDNDSDALEGADWQAQIQWSPVTPLLVELKTARSEQQSYRLDAQVIDLKSTSLSVRRSVGRGKIQMTAEQVTANFFGSPREDEILNGGLTLEYLAARYLYFVGNLGYSTRDSELADREYDRFSSYVGIRIGR